MSVVRIAGTYSSNILSILASFDFLSYVTLCNQTLFSSSVSMEHSSLETLKESVYSSNFYTDIFILAFIGTFFTSGSISSSSSELGFL